MARPQKSKKIPVMYYQNISKKDLEKNNSSKKSFDFGPAAKKNKQKQIWLWSAVTVIMAAILISWISILPRQLKVRASGPNIEKELFTSSGNELSDILAEQKQATDDIKKLLSEEIKTLTASSTASAINNSAAALSEKQIEELKNKIQKNNP